MTLTRAGVSSYAGFIVLSMIWGLAFVAIRQADTELSPVNLALARWLVTGVVFLVLLPMIGRPKAKIVRGDVPRFLIVAVANVAGYHIFLNYAETSLSAGLSSLLIALGPVFMVILSALLLNEKAGPSVVLALLLAVAGTFVLSLNSFSASDLSSLLGPLEAVASAFCYALFTVLGKPLVSRYGSAPVTIIAGLLGTVMILPILFGNFGTQVQSLTEIGWVSVLYLGVLSSGLGYLLYYAVVSRKSVTRLAIQLYLIPIVSVIGGAILLSEPVTILTVVGGAMMLAAVALATRH